MAMTTTEVDFEQQTAVSARNTEGLITRPQSTGVTPAGMAEQNRVIAEIQASLTVAQARPRDEAVALERILITCQRPSVAADSSYEYSRGGQEITGPNIRVMEIIAQKWGNIEWGFRELARFQGLGSLPGESVVEAFAWDLESNSRRKVQFTVRHMRDKKGGGSSVKDERDIYELVANYAQRRVRTCLENVIPRDITDQALLQCDETNRTHEEVTPEKIHKLLGAFVQFGVTKEHIEAKLQRKIDTMSPAAMVKLRRIFASLRDGVANATDFFDVAVKAESKSAVDEAKDKMRKGSKKTEAAAESTSTKAKDEPKSEEGNPDADEDPASIVEAKITAARDDKNSEELQSILDNLEGGQVYDFPAATVTRLAGLCRAGLRHSN